MTTVRMSDSKKDKLKDIVKHFNEESVGNVSRKDIIDKLIDDKHEELDL